MNMSIVFPCLLMLVGDHYGDMRFAETQENWVVDASRGGHRNLNAIADPRTAALIRLMGSPEYYWRELASERLEKDGERVFRPLLWGCRHRDREIAFRCNILVDKLFSCKECNGRGVVDNRYPGMTMELHDVPITTNTTYYQCFRCNGKGNMRHVR